jgi:hypothetical protein
MGTDTTRIAARATPQAQWRLFEDIAGWTNWNAGGARISLLDGVPDLGVADETPVADTRFRVSHDLQPLPAGGTRITWAIRVGGRDA